MHDGDYKDGWNGDVLESAAEVAEGEERGTATAADSDVDAVSVTGALFVGRIYLSGEAWERDTCDNWVQGVGRQREEMANTIELDGGRIALRKVRGMHTIMEDW